MAAKLSDSARDQAAQAIALFSALIHAWHTHNAQQELRARDSLRKLGVVVHIDNPSEEEAPDATDKN